MQIIQLINTNTINLNFVILKNTVRLKNDDNAADVIFH